MSKAARLQAVLVRGRAIDQGPFAMPSSNRASKAQHVLADVLTCCNLAAGINAILLDGEGRPVRRSTLILVGAACDSLDGPLARRSGNPTDLGAAGDGISDVISFGIAPAVILASRRPADPTLLDRLAPRLFMAGIAWRGARYGFGPRTTEVFRGLPAMAAGVLMAIGFELKLPPRIMGYLGLLSAIGMVSGLRVPSGAAIFRPELRTFDRRA